MITRPYGVSPTVDVNIGGVSIRYESITSLVVTLEENMHDLVELVIAGFPIGAASDYWNKPIKISIDNGANLYYEFIGYVDKVHPTGNSSQGFVNYSPIQAATVVCLGASYAMRGSHTRVWSKHRFEDVVSNLAFKYGFSADCVRKGKVYDYLVQTGESDWKFLTKIADLQGLSVNCHGAHLHIYDPYKSFSRRISFHVLHSLSTSGGDPAPAPGQVLEFKGKFGQSLPEQSSVLMGNGKTIDLNSPHKIALPLLTKTTVHDLSVEQGLARIDATRKHSYDHTAQVSVTGVAGCLPGGIVKITGYDQSIDDYWYVKAVKHKISEGSFVSDLSIARNIDNELTETNTPTFTVRRDNYFDGTKWVARKRSTNVYS